MIRKIEVQRYTLRPRSFGARSRTGALLRVTFSDLEHAGIADLFPWSIYGDPTLDTWLDELRIGLKNGALAIDPVSSGVSVTLRIALRAARDEAEAISRGESLVNGSVVNHWLAADPLDMAPYDVLEARRSGCPAIKVKIGHDEMRKEAAALARLVSHWGSLRLRLDANERWTRDELRNFLDALPIHIHEAIEFIEDPFAFDLQSWSDFHRETGIPLAYDRGTRDRDLVTDTPDNSGAKLSDVFEAGAAQVLVHKPAWQDEARAVFARQRGIPIVVTSILGHPVGNLWAASRAFKLAPESVHGCRSHTVYRDDEASLTLVKSGQVRGARVVGTGTGLGLQSPWWRRLRWEPLV